MTQIATTAEQLGLSLPEPTVARRPFPSFKLLSFDIYGTLIDWEDAIIRQLTPKLTSQIPSNSTYRKAGSDAEARLQLAKAFNEVERTTQAELPGLKYSELLEQVYLRLAQRWGIQVTENIKAEALQFGISVGTWDAFSDTVDAMQRLSKYFKLVPLSNVDRESFAGTNAGPLQGLKFWRICTAQDIGSYKPDLRNFEYLIKHVNQEDLGEGGIGIQKEDILHVAQSLFHDHIPAKAIGLSSVWIDREGAGMGGGAEGTVAVHEKGEVGYGWRFPTLGAFADQVEGQFSAGEPQV